MRHVYVRLCVYVVRVYVCLSHIKYVLICKILSRRACSFAWEKASPSFSLFLSFLSFLFFFYFILFINFFSFLSAPSRCMLLYSAYKSILRCFETRKVGVICAGIDIIRAYSYYFVNGELGKKNVSASISM